MQSQAALLSVRSRRSWPTAFLRRCLRSCSRCRDSTHRQCLAGFLLGGGLPFGSVCELTGANGSGHSSIALSLLASASKEVRPKNCGALTVAADLRTR